MNKSSKGQEAILRFFKLHHRLPTFDEVFDIYTDHVLKSQTECWMTVNGEKTYDKPLWRIKDSCLSWFSHAVGRLVIRNKLKLKGGTKC